MKAFKIKTYEKNGKTYFVRLGNSTTHEFKTLIQVNKFLAETNRFLTCQLFDLNQILSELCTFYREQWILSDKRANDNEVKGYLDAAENCMILGVRQSEWKDGHLLAFYDLKKSCNFLKSAIAFYSKIIDKKKNDTTARYKLKTLFDRVIDVERKIDGYGQENASHFFDSPRFSDLLTDVSQTYSQAMKNL
jgi:hypothetical protein